MSGEEFEEVVAYRLQQTNKVLVEKAKEYANDTNRLHNFDKAAWMSGQTREKALRGMLLKHLVSFDDIIEKIDNNELPSLPLLEEKVGDIINYYILLEASIKDRIKKQA